MLLRLLLSTFLLTAMQAFGQSDPGEQVTKILSRAEIQQLFNDSVKEAFGITAGIRSVYQYTDLSGSSYVVLSEQISSTVPGEDTLYDRIKALSFNSTAGRFEKQWEINDFALKETEITDGESSIWFWTKYAELRDINSDGLIDPLLVYGTAAENGYYDGRIKILVFYKGNKIVIRHQNSEFDEGRYTQVDAAFYKLPAMIQKQVKDVMEHMTDNGHAIFPYGWQAAMKKHALKFDEVHRN